MKYVLKPENYDNAELRKSETQSKQKCRSRQRFFFEGVFLPPPLLLRCQQHSRNMSGFWDFKEGLLDCKLVFLFAFVFIHIYIYLLEYLKHLFRIKALTSCCHQVTVFKVVFVSSVTFPEYLQQEVSFAEYLQEEQISFETKGSQQGSS